MGRRVKIRTSYQYDAMFLTRLIAAVEGDKKRSPEWRKTVISHLQEVVALFLRESAKQSHESGNSDAA